MFVSRCFRSCLASLTLATLIALAPACRTGSTPEAGVDKRLFERSGASLGYNPRGYWFAVAPQKSKITNFVTIEHDGKSELFYAVARGERAAQLLPLTPVESDWFDGAVEANASPIFVDDFSAAKISDRVGYWTGGEEDNVSWRGETPSGAMSAVAVPAKAPDTPTPFYRWASGVVSIEDGRVTSTDRKLEKGPYLLLPDGVDQEQKLRVVDITEAGFEVADDDGVAFQPKKGPAFDKQTISKYAALPVGRQLGADLLVFDVHDTNFVFNVAPDQTRLGAKAHLVPAVAEIPLVLRKRQAILDVARGFEALREGRPLAASLLLNPDVVGVANNSDATALRLAELPGAAGMSQWSRVALLDAADGMSADRVLYLARAHALEGDLAQAGMYAVQAASSFREWPSPTNRTGTARAKLLSARLAALEGDSQRAIELARRAVEEYKVADDTLRRADAEMQLADHLYAAGSPDGAIKYVKLARSRYYHGGSPYFSALAEIKLAELYLEINRPEKALEMSGYAVSRMEKFDEPVGLVRAEIVRALGEKQAGKTHDISGQLENGLARARELRDVTAQGLAAAGLVAYAGADDPEQMVELARILTRTQDATSDAIAAQNAQRAIASLCGQGLTSVAAKIAEADASAFEQKCATAVRKLAGDPETIREWLEQGYGALQSGRLALARSTAKELGESVDEKLETSAPVLAAEIYFFRYAVATAPTVDDPKIATDDENIGKGVALLDKALDPKTAAGKIHELAREHRRRGITTVAASLGIRGMKAARAAKQYEVERELLFFLLDTYQTADMPSEVLSLARDGRKVVSRAGPGSDALEARVLMYQSDAEYRLGRASDGGLHRSNALATANDTDTAARLDLLLLAAELDMDRRATEAAEPSLVAALKIDDALAPEKRTSDEYTGLLTHLHTLHGELAVRLGKLEAARKAFDTALGLSTDTDAPQIMALRARALAGKAGLAADADARASQQEKLVALLDQTANFENVDATIDAHRTGVEYFTDASDASQAVELAERVHEAGFALAPRRQAVCITGRARLFAGKTDTAMRDLKICQAANNKEVSAAFAELLIALTDESLTAKQRAARAASLRQNYADKLTESEDDRFALVESLAAPTTGYDERRARRLQSSADKTSKPADIAAYASYLLSVGRIGEANAYIDKHSSNFYKQGQESPGTLVRLRLEAMVRQLQPVEASLYAQRALSETTNLAEEERARIDFLLAQNEVVAGRWWRAASLLAQARKGATDRDLRAQIDAFAKKFPPLAR